VGDEQHNMMQQQSDHLCKEVREETERAVQRSVQKEVHEGVNGELSEMRKEMSQMTQEIKWMKDQCSGLEGLVLEVHEAGREMYEVRQEFDRVGACTECIWEFLTKEVGKGFEPAVRRSFGVLGDVLVEAVEEMRQMSDDMSVRQGRFEEVARESVRQEVRVQECMGTAVSEEMSKSDERLRGVLRDLKGQLGVLQKEMRVGMMRVQQRGGRGEEVMSENGSSAAATELAEGRRAREKGAGLWEGAVYEGQQGEGVQLFAGPPMQWVGGGRE
jgi:phage-related tail protein